MDIKQKQCLLFFLGYYKGDIDGDWGNQSIEATLAFQRAYGLTDDGVFGEKTEKRIREVIGSNEAPAKTQSGDWWDDIKYFDRSEFACKCGKHCNGYPTEMKEKVVRVVERARKHFGAPCTVSSGLRCSKHNAAVGGVSNSRHLAGKAVDCCIQGVSGSKLLAYFQAQPEVRYAYVIEGNFVHVDIA